MLDLKHLRIGEYLRMSMSLVIIFTHHYKFRLGVSWHIATNSVEKYWIPVSQWAVRGRKNYIADITQIKHSSVEPFN